MKKRIYDDKQFSTGKWSGGETTEFAIYPETSEYVERDFIWRLSSADVIAEESAFTRLPDYDRVLMVLEGEAVLVHGGERTVKLTPEQQDSFGGETETKCFGRIRDYNLMVKKGCSGRLLLMDLKSEAEAVSGADRRDYTHASYGVYCLSGYAVAAVNGETHMVEAGKQLVLDFEAGENADMTLMGDGKAIVSEVFYTKTAHAAVEIPEEKATFEDFKTAFRLARGSNKWKQMMKRDNSVWYDEALQSKLAFLDKTYIGIILWIAVSVVFVLLAANGLSHIYAILLIAAWTVIYAFVISPLIYMLVLPKPIKAHIKRVDSLTEYERQLYESELAGRGRTDKLLRKYKYSRGEGWNVENEKKK